MNPTIRKTKKAYTPWMVSYFVGGKRFRQFRKTRAAAEDLRRDLQSRHANMGASGFDLAPADLADAIRARAILDGRISLVEAADYWIRNADAASDVTIEETVADFFASKQSSTGERYRAFLKNKIARFVDHVGEDRRIATITTREINRYLDSLPYAAETIANARRALGTLFGYALQQEIIRKNPVEGTRAPRISRGTPQFLSKTAIESIFSIAREVDPGMVTPLALSAYFGIRSYEVSRMIDADINREGRSIYLRAESSKTGHPRLIENLPEKCWRMIADPLDPPSPQMLIRRRKVIYDKAEVTSFHSALRKTFITHAVAAFQSAERVALIVGHRQTSTLHTHYRGLIGKREGAEYFEMQ